MSSIISKLTNLSGNITGTLPIANGGTGQVTANAAYNALSPMTTAGDIEYEDATPKAARLAIGSTGAVLRVVSGLPAWVTPSNPTVQNFTSGSGTYTTPANVSWIRVRMIGGGGGGGGSTTIAGSFGTAAGAGGNTTFGTTLLVANGGGGALNGSNGSNPGASGTGGTASLGSGPIGIALQGGAGVSGLQSAAAMNGTGAMGGPSAFGGAGIGATSAGTAVAGGNGVTNTGGGGGGASLGSISFSGAGGGAGGYVDAIINGPSATYSYAVGAAGTGGVAGTSGAAGGTGGSGYISVEEYYFA